MCYRLFSQMVSFVKETQEEQPIPEVDLVPAIWSALMATVDWGTRPDQIEALALREVAVRTAIPLARSVAE